MRTVTLRFGQRLWELVIEEAEHDGISTSAFIREAALARAIYARARRQPNTPYEDVLAEVRDILNGDS